MSAESMLKSRCALGKPEDQNGMCLLDIHDNLILNYTDTNTLQNVKQSCDDDLCVLETIKVPEKIAESIKREILSLKEASFVSKILS